MNGWGLDVRLPSPLVELSDERLGSVRVLLKRDDLIHPHVPGNKWRKLKYLLPAVREAGAARLLTFGGAYSNHVRAVAAVGRRTGLATVGVIRGEERPYNDVLADAEADGMQLHYLDRAAYRRKSDDDVMDRLRREFGDFYLVPEGGSTVHALPGCAEIVDEIDQPFDLIVTAVGTGGTLAGLATGLVRGQRALGVSVLKGVSSLESEIAGLHQSALGFQLDNWSIDHRFHHGGFARRTAELDRFVTSFEERHRLQLDHIYVGKMMFGLFAMVAGGELPTSSVVVAVITGPTSNSDSRSSRHSPDLIV